jgi:5-methyltetrahydrofolate--homocysteine methyltransferase
MGNFEVLAEAIIKADIARAVEETKKALDEGTGVQEILDQGLIEPMDEVGSMFASGKMFVPQMLRSAKAMQECMSLIKPFFKEQDISFKGTVVIGTVKGDLHDIGKNLVSMMMEGAGITIVDLGVDISAESFVQKVREADADILAMSALLSTTMPGMKEAIEALKNEGLRDKVKVMIGGAPVSESFAREIGADAYAPDAGTAVAEAKKLLGTS